MQKAITSLSKWLLVASFAICTGWSHASETACPDRHADKPLSTGYVLDGPVQDKAILEADHGGRKAGVEYGDWEVGYIYEAGRQVSLECHYDGVATPYIVTIESSVKACAYRKSKKHGVTLSCQ